MHVRWSINDSYCRTGLWPSSDGQESRTDREAITSGSRGDGTPPESYEEDPGKSGVWKRMEKKMGFFRVQKGMLKWGYKCKGL